MTRRGLLAAAAAITATALSLALFPMQMNALAVLGAWAGSVALAVLLAMAADNLMWRHERRAMCSQVLREARRVLR